MKRNFFLMLGVAFIVGAVPMLKVGVFLAAKLGFLPLVVLMPLACVLAAGICVGIAETC